MTDKMLRVAGRDTNGKAKAFKTSTDGTAKIEANRNSKRESIRRTLENQTRRETIQIPEHCYGIVIHNIIHDWDESSSPTLQVNVRNRIRGFDTFGYKTDKIDFNSLEGGKSALLPSIQSIYVCPEAMYLEQYPPRIGKSESSYKFIQLETFPVRLSDEVSVLLEVTGEIEIEMHIDFLM